MAERGLFERALGLRWPWRVKRTEFDAAERRLDPHSDFEPGGTFDCRSCGRGGCKAHDSSPKRWRHLDFFQHRAYLHARVPRVRSGVRSEAGEGAVGGAGFGLHAVVRGAGGGPGAGDAGQGGGPAGGRARHAAVAASEAPRGTGAGGGGLLVGARGGRGRDGVSAGPRPHHAVRRPGPFAASVRDAGARRFGREPVPGGPRGARGPGRERPGSPHGHVGGVHEGGAGGVPGGRDHLRPFPRPAAHEQGGGRGEAGRAQGAPRAEPHPLPVAQEARRAHRLPARVDRRTARSVAAEPEDGPRLPVQARLRGVPGSPAAAGRGLPRDVVFPGRQKAVSSPSSTRRRRSGSTGTASSSGSARGSPTA